MKRLTFLLIVLFMIFSPLLGDYYNYKKGNNWRDFYGYYGWKSVYKYEGWKRVYKYESWRDVYGYYGWRETYLKRYSYPFHPHRLRGSYLRGQRLIPVLFFKGYIFCIR